MTITAEMVSDALGMFAFLAVELTLLYLLISYGVGVLLEYLPPHRVQSILSSKGGKGYVIAGFLGAITPFCSCSTIPFLKGLLRANAGFGTMMVFLFASPLLNPIVIGLFAVTFGLKITLSYFAIAMGVSIAAGYTLEKLGFEKHIKPEAYLTPEKKGCASSCGDSSAAEPVAVESKWMRIWRTTWSDFLKVVPYLIAGISLGSLIYGFMPSDFVASVAGESNPLAIPVAAVIGIPLYISSTAMVPLSAALLTKGMGLGAVMALVIGSAGASLTEVILLKAIFNNQMIMAFLFVVLGMAVGAGYFYSYVF
ncbi:permease [Marinobacterium jannaschii]|uniref:permease n=1 Tax=Marinobacterium jannaschii TaxID=64970 RepID=UPI00047FE300|nr:permease [Marinobacterium jannaschii]